MFATLDISSAVNGKAGLGRYAASLAAALEQARPGQLRLFFNSTQGVSRLPPALRSLPRRSVPLGYKAWRLAVWLGQIARLTFEPLIGDSALFHATEHLLLPLRRTPTVLTVHDLIYRLFPQHHTRLNYSYLNAAMPLYVRRADHIIAVSHTTRNDLIRLYGTPAKKITVIYEAAAAHFQPQPPQKIGEVRARYGLPERYLLAVGTIEPRKNLARLVEMLAILRRQHPDLRLVVAGSRGWLTGNFLRAIETHRQQDGVILPGYVPDGDLPSLYSGAAAALTASYYEGFGLPVLEAMACGAPVACSATSGLGEIAADAALTFDPDNTAEMAEAVGRILTDSDLAGVLRQKGLARAANFSWERAAQETWAVYDKIAGHGNA